jgi:putative membrane protein
MCGVVSRKEHTMMMWYGGDWGWASWILMTVGMVAFWALVITAVVLAVRYLAGPRGTAASPSGCGETRAEGVLAERFARGEIDENEYRQRLSLLREYP